MVGKKLNNIDAVKFIFAGNSTVTFLNINTKNRFTYHVKMSKDGSVYFVSVLTNTENYEYIGIVVNNHYTHGKKSNISYSAQSVKVFEYILSKLKSNTLPDFIEIWHEGKCGRPLTVPESIDIGIGPECLKKLSSPEFKKSLKRDSMLKQLLGD
jgi:hypothetical protein